MKKSKKLIFGALATASATLVVTPLVTSCSNSSDINQVERGDGKDFANYKFNGQDKTLSFEEVLAQAAASKDGFTAFKQQIAKELVYNWYYGIKESSKAPQSFKDNWNTWTDAAKKAYDDKVQSYKDSHKKAWEYYFQNEVLDPVGGTKDAFIRQQMYDKVYEGFKNVVFTNNYLSYSAEPYTGEGDKNPVNSNVGSFTETKFNDPTTWKDIGFYAKANTAYRVDTQDLDDVYAIIQQQAFNAYTEAKHPQALLMALWKYAAPSDGMYTVYSKNIPSTDEEKKNSNNVSAGEETTKTLKAKYETPAFPKWSGGEYTANGKFNQLVTEFFVNPTFGSGTNNLDTNGMFRYINSGATYQDDGSTMGFVLNMNEMYSKLDAWFCPAVTEMYQQAINITASPAVATSDYFLDYKASDLIKYGYYNGQKGTIDILSNFFFRSGDSRVFDGATLTTLGSRLKTLQQKGTVLDLSQTFESSGTASNILAPTPTKSTNFQSDIFLNAENAIGNYFGKNNNEGGVQWAVNALWLTDDWGNRLPYVLFRDTNGVHLCGIYGAWDYDPTTTGTKTPRPGFLANTTYDASTYGAAWSQGRQNIMLKALNLFMKTRNESLFDISSEVKTYFTNNAEDIIINMALAGTQRGNTDKSVIFDFSKVLDSGIDQPTFKAAFDNSTIFFLLQNTLTSYLEANKKLYALMSTHITNSLMSRSSGILSKNTSDNYKNAVATPMPYIGEYKQTAATGTVNVDFYKGFLTFSVTNPSIWINASGTTNPVYITDPKTDTWTSSFTTTSNTNNATTFLKAGVDGIVGQYADIITKLGLTKATLPDSSYANWSEHLNPKYSYSEDKATNAITNGLYMAINKFLDGTQEPNRIKLSAYQAYATSTDSIFEKAPSIDNFELGEIKNTGNFKGLKNAVATMMYANKAFTTDTPLSYYDMNAANGDDYVALIERIGQQSIAHSATASKASDDLISYWTFIDTLQYLVNNNYAKLMEYLKTSVMSYGVEADLVWICEDNKDANPDFLTDASTVAGEAAKFGWQPNYFGKYSYTYLPTANMTSANAPAPSSYIDNTAYYQAAPLKYDASNTILGMGFAGLATSSNSPSVITSTLQNALFTETYKSKTNPTKSEHFGGWYKYGDLTKLEEYIKTLSSVADIQKIATNLGAANEDSEFTSNVVDVVKRTTFQDGDPEIGKLKLNGKDVVAGQALTPDVLKARLLGGSQTIEQTTIDYTTWGLESYKNMTGKSTIISNLFTRFGGLDGVAAELYDVHSNRHAMRVTSESATAGNYAKMMVIQLNNDDFKDVASLNTALTGDATDYELLNYIAVQYAQQSSLQTQATNDVVKTILGDDNKVTVYDRRLNDKLGPTWVKDYKATN